MHRNGDGIRTTVKPYCRRIAGRSHSGSPCFRFAAGIINREGPRTGRGRILAVHRHHGRTPQAQHQNRHRRHAGEHHREFRGGRSLIGIIGMAFPPLPQHESPDAQRFLDDVGQQRFDGIGFHNAHQNGCESGGGNQHHRIFGGGGTLLENHPWFELVTLAASAHSAGKTYEEAIGSRWKMETPMPEFVKHMVVKNVADVEDVVKDVDFVFSAVNMPKDEIRAIEEEYAKTETPVVSNNSAHRWTPDVPMVVPEINPEHYEVIEHQKKRLGTTRGFIAVKPNCSIQAYTPALAAWKEFEPHEVIVSTYQAISGAGKTFKDWPEMVGNIIPFISGEEAKSEKEPLKVFGHVDEAKGEIVPFDGPLRITSQCIRVPVLNGHTATVFINFGKNPTKDELIDRLVNYTSKAAELGLPHAPKHFIQYLTEDDRPQVLKDVDYEGGMGVSIGRLREDSIFDWKFVGLAHNTLRGAAGGALESAEMLKALGYITKK